MAKIRVFQDRDGVWQPALYGESPSVQLDVPAKTKKRWKQALKSFYNASDEIAGWIKEEEQ